MTSNISPAGFAAMLIVLALVSGCLGSSSRPNSDEATTSIGTSPSAGDGASSPETSTEARQAPHKETTTYEFKIACSTSVVATCGLLAANPFDETRTVSWDFVEKEYPVQQVLELLWTPSTAYTAQKVSINYYAEEPQKGTNHMISDFEGPSPIRVVVDGNKIESAGEEEWAHEFSIYAAHDGAIVDQTFKLYRTDFFGQPAPEGFTAITPEA